MANIRYALHDVQTIDTGKLLYVTSATYGADWRSFPHTHYYSEIFYVVSGSGRFHVQGEEFPVAQGDIVIVNPHIRHTEVSAKEDPMTYIVLGIESLSFIMEQNRNGCAVLHSGGGQQELLHGILAEMREKRSHYEQVCQNLLENLLIYMMRSTDFSLTVAPATQVSNECFLAKQYIEGHSGEDITLDTLVEVTHLNKFYLSHSFTRAYGISPINYLREQRIRSAKEHLSGTDVSIAQVAQLAGFSSQSYFTQVFKRVTGLSPSVFRKRTRGGDKVRVEQEAAHRTRMPVPK